MVRYVRKDGRPSAYQFLCGHAERVDFKGGFQSRGGASLEMYMEHNCYHVRLHTSEKIQKVWDTFDDSEPGKLARARKRFYGLKRELTATYRAGGTP